MDYSIMLTQIINNQTEMLEVMQDIFEFLGAITFIFFFFLFYIFIRNVISSK